MPPVVMVTVLPSTVTPSPSAVAVSPLRVMVTAELSLHDVSASSGVALAARASSRASPASPETVVAVLLVSVVVVVWVVAVSSAPVEAAVVDTPRALQPTRRLPTAAAESAGIRKRGFMSVPLRCRVGLSGRGEFGSGEDPVPAVVGEVGAQRG